MKAIQSYGKAAMLLLAALLIGAGAVQTASAQEAAGTFEEGRALGITNGSLLVQRVRHQTIDANGCRDLPRFQRALLQVVRRITPTRRSDAFVRGYYNGYSAVVRQGIREARAQCGVATFYDGEYPGSLSGELFCSMMAAGPEVLVGYEFEPIYENWAFDEDVKTTCQVAFTNSVTECGGTVLADIMGAAKVASCI